MTHDERADHGIHSCRHKRGAVAPKDDPLPQAVPVTLGSPAGDLGSARLAPVTAFFKPEGSP
jgi:hypothetical protein